LFGKDVQFLSVTIDPERDTPELLRKYAEQFEADPEGWKFLRGDEKETADLARKYQILVQKDNDGNFGHMNLIVLLDKKGQIRDWISANDFIDMEGTGERLSPSEITKKIKKPVIIGIHIQSKGHASRAKAKGYMPCLLSFETNHSNGMPGSGYTM